MAGSPFVKIDRLYEKEIRARAREANKNKQLVSCTILEFFQTGDGFQADWLSGEAFAGREPVRGREMGAARMPAAFEIAFRRYPEKPPYLLSFP